MFDANRHHRVASRAGRPGQGMAGLAASVLVLGLVGCSNVTDPGGEEGDQTTVTIAWAQDISTLDQAKGTSQGDFVSLENVYDSFMRRGTDGELLPGLVTSWETSDDGLELTLHLREGVLFHNGEEMTAEDVVYSIERWIDPDFPGATYQGFHSHIAGAEVVDDYTVRVVNNELQPTWMIDSPTRTPIIPASLGEELGYEGFGADPSTAIGTGPFKVVEWVRDDRLVLEAFDDYWGGRPAIDRVVIRPIPEGSARTAALLAGDIDIAQQVAVTQLEVIEQDPDVELRPVDGTARSTIALNTQIGGPLAELDVRKAIAYAIDTQSIMDNVLDGFGTLVPTFSLPVEQAYNDQLEPYGYDPELARTLLEQAGYGDGIDGLRMYSRSREPKGEEVIQAIQAMLAEVGIETEVTVALDDDFQQLMQDRALDIAVYAHRGGGSFHPNFGLTEVFGCEFASASFGTLHCNEQVRDLLVDASDVGKSDLAAADGIYLEIQEILYEDYAVAGAWAQPFIFGVNSDLDWPPNAAGTNWMGDASWRQ